MIPIGSCLGVVFFSGKAFVRFPQRGPGTLWPGGRCRRRDIRTGSNGCPDTCRRHCGGRCPGEAAGRWARSSTGTSTATKRTHCTLSQWPVNSPVVDRRDRPIGLQHTGLRESKDERRKLQSEEKAFRQEGTKEHSSFVCLPPSSGSVLTVGALRGP